jgi:nicotinamide mononucleotide (NMN) deamidase PncC
MDPVLMAGAWAAAVIAIAGASKLFLNAFTKATRAVVNEEFKKIWRDMDESDRWHQERFSSFEKALEQLREQVQRLEQMMQAHMQKEQ